MEIIVKNINDLKGYENNARVHSKEQIQEIVDSIKNYGFNDPIEIDSNDVILSGHARIEAAKISGLTEVPTICHSHLKDNKQKGYILAANKIAQNATWDYLTLKGEMTTLVNDGFDMKSTGFSQDEIDAILKNNIANETFSDPDEIPELKPDSITKIGDIWILGNHRLMCGNSINILDVEKLLDNVKPEMIYTDPPYGIDENTDRVRSKRTQAAKAGVYDKIIGDTNTETAIDAFNLVQSMEIPLMVFWGANHYCHALPESANWLVWDKRVEDKQRDGNSDCELAWIKSKAKSVRIFRHLWKGMIKASEQGESRVHPTQKPVALAEWCFNEYAQESINILDLFGGSGSTLIACEKTNRKCFMMELSPDYCDVIIKRWQKFTGKKAVLESTGETFNV